MFLILNLIFYTLITICVIYLVGAQISLFLLHILLHFIELTKNFLNLAIWCLDCMYICVNCFVKTIDLYLNGTETAIPFKEKKNES